jgi:PAS domain S-box-containing protein
VKQKIKILQLEDILSDTELVERELENSCILFEKIVVDNRQDFIRALKEFIPDIILSDHKLPSFDSLEALKIISDACIIVPFILVTATMSEEFAVEIMKKGANDYILKDRLQRLPSAVLNAVEKCRLIKERQKYYDRIVANDAMLEQTEQLAHIGSFEVEIKTDLVKWSDECYRIMGYDVNEIVPSLQVFLSRIHPEDLNYVTENIQEALHSSNSLNLEYRIKLNDDSIRFIRSKFLLYRNEEKYPVTIRGFIQDITETRSAEEGRRKIEKELQATYERLLFRIENSPLGFIEWDSQTMVKSWSKRAEEIFGWSEKEFIDSNKSGFSQVYKEDLPRIRKIAEELINGIVERNTVQHRNYTKDGRVIWCEWFNSVLKDQNGKVVTIMSLVQDITERKKAEEELRNLTEQLRNLASHLQNIREEERLTIAREIHDELGQQLTGLKIDISFLSKKINTKDKEVKQKINTINKLLDETVKTVRRIATELRPLILDNLGFIEAMKWQSEEFKKRSGIRIEFTSSVNEIILPDNILIGLFRIYQEALTNIARHSEATIVSAIFERNEKNVILCIKDNGKGFNAASIDNKKTLGLLGIKERALMMGGICKISGITGKGVIISISVPLNEDIFNELF